MVIYGRLSSLGIALEDNTSADSIFCCTKVQQNQIRYRDVIAIEQHEQNIYLVSYLDSSTQPSSLKQKLIRINVSNTSYQHSSREFLHSDYSLEEETGEETGEETVDAYVLNKAYLKCRRPSERLPILVIINPKSGPGFARAQYDKISAPIFKAAGLRTKVIETKYSGEAKEIAQHLSTRDHDTIVLVSGDGLCHEVLNGLATRPTDASQALQHFGLAQLPGGSGNAMSLSLNDGTNDWGVITLGILKGHEEPHDIMCISQDNQVYYSFLSQSYGIVADCDLGTEHLRWMGNSRFTLGIIYKCLSGNSYPCEIAYKEGHSEYSTSLTPQTRVNDSIPSDWVVEKCQNLSMFYVGKMPWMSSDAQAFPLSQPLDGSMDMLQWNTNFGGINALTSLMNMQKGAHVERVPCYKKILAYRLTPLKPDQYLSIDGESYPCTPIQVSVIRGGAKFIHPFFTI